MPVFVGDPELCKEASDLLLADARHLHPADQLSDRAKGTERLRITPTPRHTHAQIGVLVEALADVWQTLGIPFVEPPAHLQVDKNAERCTYPEIKLAAQ